MTTIFISDAALDKMEQYQKEGLNIDQICDKLKSDGFSKEETISVRALLDGSLQNRKKVITKTITVEK